MNNDTVEDANKRFWDAAQRWFAEAGEHGVRTPPEFFVAITEACQAFEAEVTRENEPGYRPTYTPRPEPDAAEQFTAWLAKHQADLVRQSRLPRTMLVKQDRPILFSDEQIRRELAARTASKAGLL